MNHSTPAEQVYFNFDLLKLILSYNQCSACHCVGSVNNKNNPIKPVFFTNFYDVFCLQQWKPLYSICKLCLNHSQFYNDSIIFRNRNDVMNWGGKYNQRDEQKKWIQQKGKKRSFLI